MFCNPLANPTILSGDIGIIGDNSDNTSHVVVGNNITIPTLIDGFTIEKGNALGDSGGGMNILNSSVNLTNCSFSSNNALNSGGAIFVGLNSLVIFTDCTFEDNTSASGLGRVISVTGAANVVLEDCNIIDAAVGSEGSTVENTENSV